MNAGTQLHAHDRRHLRPIAAVDIGSNSIHLTLARVDERGEIEVLEKHKYPARLADTIRPDKTMSADGIERTVETLKKFRDVATKHQAEVRATATAAVRAARNRKELLSRVAREAGIEVDVISGKQEARLTYSGVMYGLPHLSARQVLCVDVGGGSTELLVGLGGRAERATSARVGSAVISKRFFGSDPVTFEQIRLARRNLRHTLWHHVRGARDHGFEHAVATSGTIKRVVKLAHGIGALPESAGNQNSVWLPREALDAVVDALAAAPTRAERLALPGMDPTRVDVMLSGALIFETLTRMMDLDGWTVSSAALRTGLILETLRRRTAPGTEKP